jgi:hypothetical protein
LLARLKTADAISMMACQAIQRFVQKRAVFLSLTVTRVEAKNISRSLVLNCRSRPIQGLEGSLWLSQMSTKRHDGVIWNMLMLLICRMQQI